MKLLFLVLCLWGLLLGLIVRNERISCIMQGKDNCSTFDIIKEIK